jgi:hypothetical protein
MGTEIWQTQATAATEHKERKSSLFVFYAFFCRHTHSAARRASIVAGPRASRLVRKAPKGRIS